MRVTLFRDLPTEGWPSMERYADELTAGLQAQGCDLHPYVLARPLPKIKGLIGALANYAWRSTAYPLAARSQLSDLNHIVDHTYAHLVDALDPGRTVVTCHDLAPLALDVRGRGLGRRLWDRSFRAMLRAAHIVADSVSTRDEIVRRTDYPADRITVIPLGVSRTFFEPVGGTQTQRLRSQFGLADRPIILHVGSCQPHKNVEIIFRGLVELLDLKPLLAQIGGRFSRVQWRLISSLGVRAHVVQVGRVSEQALRTWYQTADAFVFPSLYEGFGLPVLEAMAAGAPVVCAHAGPLPEIAGDAALMVDPRDAHALAEAIHRVLTDQALRRALVDAGRARAREFTWDQTARRTLQVYRSVHESLAA